jgi:hypothetical protein
MLMILAKASKAVQMKDYNGWVVDTRLFIIAAPQDKHTVWSRSSHRILSNKHAKMKTKDLETTLR